MKENMAADERTPLIQHVDTSPVIARYPHRALRKTCTWIVAIIAVVAVVLLLVPLPLSGDGTTSTLSELWVRSVPPSAWPESSGLDYAMLQHLLMKTPDEHMVRKWSQYYTSGPHLAGQNYSQAKWTQERWQDFGIEQTSIATYDVYLNYPKGHRVALLETKGKSTTIKYEARLEEEVFEKDHTSGLDDRIPTFHGYSASGNVTAQYVWVNYGTYEDYEDLVKAGVELEGKIALAKYGGVFRGVKVKRAQDLGMIGCLIYTDPGDDGPNTEEHGIATYPNGPARAPSSVQRGSVQFLSTSPGDPTTPGWPSKPGAPRVNPDDSKPSIPSVPLSYEDALPLLLALNGHGPKASSFNKYWSRGNGLGYKGVKYNIGPSPPELTVNLFNDQKYVTTPLWNVIGVINGTLQDEVIVLGNHRDAWIAGGAADPNSGSAALNEVVRSFGRALKAGWKPLRTIVFASWDGEEYALIGSTEWVEEYLPWLSGSAVAYLNVDVGTSGTSFSAAGAPLLDGALIETAKAILSPNQTIEGQTVYDLWDKRIRTMGSGSDFTAFQDFAGIPCTDFGFTPGNGGASSPQTGDPVYMYHSNYDSFDWMNRFGDPGWHYHIAAAQLWSHLAARLAESPIIPFSAENYAAALERYTADKKKAAAAQIAKSADEENEKNEYRFTQLDTAIAKYKDAARVWDAYARMVADEVEQSRDWPWYRLVQKIRLFYKVRRINRAYKFLEREFLHAEGLDGRTWFKHTVFAPGLWTGYAGATFPGIVESIEAGDVSNFYRWQSIISSKLRHAAGTLAIK